MWDKRSDRRFHLIHILVVILYELRMFMKDTVICFSVHMNMIKNTFQLIRMEEILNIVCHLKTLNNIII